MATENQSNLKCPETDSDIEIPSEKAAQAKILDDIFDQLCAIVTELGPYHLMRGVTQLEANTAILRCIESLKNQRDLAFRIIDELPAYNVGISFLSEEKPKQLIEELTCLRQTTE
jgi:hypothetical protein